VPDDPTANARRRGREVTLWVAALAVLTLLRLAMAAAAPLAPD
jgi:hypothetical protein